MIFLRPRINESSIVILNLNLIILLETKNLPLVIKTLNKVILGIWFLHLAPDSYQAFIP
jgi:hypothetical protein